MKSAPKITDRVAEFKAFGYAGFSPNQFNREKLRANVPHEITSDGIREVRRYLVADCIAYKVRRESVGKIQTTD